MFALNLSILKFVLRVYFNAVGYGFDGRVVRRNGSSIKFDLAFSNDVCRVTRKPLDVSVQTMLCANDVSAHDRLDDEQTNRVIEIRILFMWKSCWRQKSSFPNETRERQKHLVISR